jgi:hypothetical protein
MTPSIDSRVDYVRSHPTTFLGPSGKPDLRDLAAALVTDALCLGAHPVIADRLDEWYVVAAKLDWIRAETKLTVQESFHRVQIFHKHRQNSTRANIIVTAFTKEVVTIGPEETTFIKGDEQALSQVARALAQKYLGHRIVAFRGLDP